MFFSKNQIEDYIYYKNILWNGIFNIFACSIIATIFLIKTTIIYTKKDKHGKIVF